MENLATLFHFPSPAAILAIAVASSVTSLLIFRAVLRFFPVFGLVDNPAPYGHKRAPVPFGVGIAFFANFALFAALLVPLMPDSMHEKLYVLLALGALVSATPDIPVVVRGDRSNQYQIIMDVLDVLGRVGVTQIALATQPNK